MRYLKHLTINTKKVTTCAATDVPSTVAKTVREWIDSAIQSTTPVLLPKEFGDVYTAKVLQSRGSLVITVYAGNGDPLVSFCVAKRSQHQDGWAGMAAAGLVPPGLSVPDAPYVAVAVHAGLMSDLKAVDWLFNFEVCCAWAWCL